MTNCCVRWRARLKVAREWKAGDRARTPLSLSLYIEEFYIYIYIYDNALVYSDEIAQLVKPGCELGTPAMAEIRRRILRATQCRQL